MINEVKLKRLWASSFLHRESGKQKIFPVFVFFMLFSPLSLFAENKTVSDLVKDENGVPLPGVTVSAKGSPGGVTITDGFKKLIIRDIFKGK